MGSLREAYKKEGEARERVVARESGDTAPAESLEPKLKVNKTFAEIREDDATSARFLRFLERNGRNDIQGAILLAEQDPDKMDRQMLKKLNAEKEKFLLLMERAESTIKALDARTIAKLTEINAGLHDVAEWGGPERINEALQSKLPEIAVEDPIRFEALARSIENQTNEEKGAEEREKQIRATFKAWGITGEETIAKLMRGGDPGEATHEIAKKLAQEKFEKEPSRFNLRKLFGKGPTEESIQEFQIIVKREIRNLASASEADLKNLEKDLARAKENIAFALEATVTKNKDVHNAVIRGVYGTPAEEADTISIKDAGKAMKFDREDVRTNWGRAVSARRDKHRETTMASKLGEWLEEQRTIAWGERMRKEARKEAIKRLTEAGTPEGRPLTEEEINEKIDELRQNYENLPAGEQDKLYELFLQEYQDPTPPRDLMDTWKKDAPDVTLEEMGSWQSEFAGDYTANHMSGHAKGKKPSYVSRAMSAIFKDLLLGELFGGSQRNP
jgi:hypothetical protein